MIDNRAHDITGTKGFDSSGRSFDFMETDVEATLSRRFEQIVQSYPDRIAIKTRDRTLTYEALNGAANRIGRAILEQIGPGSEPIALLFGNGIDLITAVIGALKAGKFFVAIDPTFPPSRITYMLGNTETRLLVTNNENGDFARTLVGYNGGYLDIDKIAAQISDDNLNLAVTSNDIATIVYTSGSTAEPKGVVKTHAYCLERAKFNIKFLSVQPDDRLSLLHSISFGSGEINLYASLLSGASLLPFNVKTEGAFGLVRWLDAERITIFHCAPSLFRQFVDYIPKDHSFSDLRLIHLSGSPITRSDFNVYRKYFPASTSLAFHMGATEAGCITCAVVDHAFSFPEKGTPAGYTREEKKVLILDDDGRPLKPGEIGEIAVQSRYLAQEYWKNPELTKARFLPAQDGGGNERIYLTGDMGRLRPDGLLIHLGRKDFMVKIRGYRVELGEVERALMEYPETKEAAVTAWEREAGETYLAAYVVSRTGGNLPVDQLAGFLKSKLPDYMIPLAFVFVESLPTINGKLDRRALPKPESKRPEMSVAYEPPGNDMERSLARIWAEVLSIDTVGIRDNFFSLGGNSLLATKTISRIHEEYQVEIPLRAIFEQPTIANLASEITAILASKAQKVDASRMLTEIESLSDDEVKELISQQPEAKKI
ncbi:MAG: AMP-binding protein [Chloroflexota bacterium]